MTMLKLFMITVAASCSAWAFGAPSKQDVANGASRFVACASDEDIEAVAKGWASDLYEEPSERIVTIGHNWAHGSINSAHESRLDLCASLLDAQELAARRARLRGIARLVELTMDSYENGECGEIFREVADYFASWGRQTPQPSSNS